MSLRQRSPARGPRATRLDRSVPLAHRVAHRFCAAGWRGKTIVWKLAERWSAPVHAVVWVGGGSLSIDRTYSLDRAIYQGFFESAELRLIAKLVRPGEACIDVGANLGLYSVLFAARSGHGPVISFEPSPTFQRLQENLSHVPCATAINMGVGAEAGSLPLHLADGDDHANFREGTSADHVVDVITLDSVPAIQDLPQIDFLKIDVEGWEPQVMAGAKGLWAGRKVGIALIEVSPMWGGVDCLQTVVDLGYQCFSLLPKRLAGGLRYGMEVLPLDVRSLPPQGNVLVVRPDRMDRLAVRTSR